MSLQMNFFNLTVERGYCENFQKKDLGMKLDWKGKVYKHCKNYMFKDIFKDAKIEFKRVHFIRDIMNLFVQTEVNYNSPVTVLNKFEHQRINKCF